MGSADPIPIQSITPLKMGTHKVKGLLKGLRYISQVFDEEKDQEIQIGVPTDVKHVAHIGCEGPALESPSWMKEFGTPGQCQSASSDMSEAPSDGPEWVSEDSSQRISRRERQEKLKSRHRRHRSMENALDPDSQGKDLPTKSRQLRRHHAKGTSSEGRRNQDLGARDESPTRKMPDIPKRTRKKKPKEESGGGSSRLSRSKANETSTQASAGSDAE